MFCVLNWGGGVGWNNETLVSTQKELRRKFSVPCDTEILNALSYTVVKSTG
jgi:hypothetical protein